MAKVKSTHQGTCQCCGHFQKLPSGRLSNHGYTKKWGFFNGTCLGAGSLPFEQSCDLIKSFIKNAQDQIKTNEKTINELETSTSSKTWFNRYKPAKSRQEKSGYYWEQVEIQDGLVNFQDGTSVPLNRYAGMGNSEEETIKHLNKARANFHRNLIKQLTEYVEWQKARIKDWKPSELSPIVEKVIDPNAPVRKRKMRYY